MHGGKAPQVERKYELYRKYLMDDEQGLFDEALAKQDLETEIAMLRVAFVRCFRSGQFGIKHLAPIARSLVALLERQAPKPKEHRHTLEAEVKQTIELELDNLSEIGKAVLDELYREAERAVARGAAVGAEEGAGPPLD